MSEELNKAKFPGVDLAYPLVAMSYDMAVRRFDAMDGRLQTIMAFIVATSATVPALAAGRGLHFRSNYFYAAIGCFAVAVVVGTVARLYGKLRVLVPREAFNHWLHKPEWEFKMDFINHSAADFEHNSTLVERKWKCSVAVTILFFAQTVCLALWALDSP
jgi:hypothetical protein